MFTWGGMRFLRQCRRRIVIAGELIRFLVDNKRIWIAPLMVLLLLVGVLIALAQSSVIAPFIYTLF
jgi:uncharacterized protein DUF5989